MYDLTTDAYQERNLAFPLFETAESIRIRP
jgi:hypothetical protein